MTHLSRSQPRRASALLAVVAALALFTPACGDDTTETSDTTTASVDGSVDSTDTTDTTGQSSTTTTTATTATTQSSTTTTGLPGQPFEGFAKDGDVLAVVGVAHDDKLNIREGPGTDQALLTRVGPLEDSLTATGRARALSRSIWYEVSTDDGITGWANSSFLAFMGGVDDATAAFLDGGTPPVTETMQQMGELVAAGFTSTEPGSRVVQSVAPTAGDLYEITYDVIGIGDDAVAGYRLHIFAMSNGDSDEGFTLKTIERTTFCMRGLAGEICV
ncbi:MAG: SH3 domain-containing protein [Acidimicrobiia bacterium]|nr:SH3 domain-containing protein [Acidimicrobiia bacterium]